MLRNLSTFFLRTLREDPADAEVNSHKLLVRAGYIRRCAPGIYTWLPLGLRTLRKIEDIVREEMEKHDVHRLLLVRVRYGALSNIVPEALSFAFEALTAGTDFEGAVLETEEVPITLKCSQCGHTFPAVKGEHFFAPCPACGEQYGHSMETGRELYVQHIEAD